MCLSFIKICDNNKKWFSYFHCLFFVYLFIFCPVLFYRDKYYFIDINVIRNQAINLVVCCIKFEPLGSQIVGKFILFLDILELISLKL